MRFKIVFQGNGKSYSDTQDMVNSFFHRMLGEDNDFHDRFSDYSLSNLMGGRIVDGVLLYDRDAYITISTMNDKLISKLMGKVFDIRDMQMRDMHGKCVEFMGDFEPNTYYDIIKLTSPLLVSHNKKYLTYKDEDFLKVLTDKSKAKLIKSGYDSVAVSTLTIEPYKFENAKTKAVLLHGSYSIGSIVRLVVKGDREIRKALYNMGMGKSTGSGFGSVEIMNTNRRTRTSTKNTMF